MEKELETQEPKIKEYKVGDKISRIEFRNIAKCIDDRAKTYRHRKAREFRVPDGSKVFFMQGTTFRRKDFKSLYPKCTITYNMTSADYVVIRESRLSEYDLFGYARTYGLSSDVIAMENSTPRDIYTSRQHQLYVLSTLCNTDEDWNVRVVGEEEIKTVGFNFEEMDDSTFSFIRSSLASKDQEAYDLAFKILFTYDYTVNKDKYMICISGGRHWSYLSKLRNKELKPIIMRMRDDFPTRIHDNR